eukprot:TRINITY_DN6028_c0_g2_i2.p1 TRINITY_DN6028_c0_g2~~TRINITY_DN6028_c0_g2_i2.p1  ORF type:complete len:498 (-),score=43.86 TRINITY_DN6028_c0_g2_i2:351-1799(-)
MTPVVVVIGAGPVGLTTAIFAARHSCQVIVVEQSSQDIQFVSPALTLGQRGLRVLDKAGLPPIPDEFLFQGTVSYLKNKIDVEKRGGQEYLIERSKLISLLMDHIAKHFSSEIQLFHELALTSIDFNAKKVHCQLGGATLEYSYDLLIGADGSNSKVREILTSAGFVSEQIQYVPQEIHNIFGPFSPADFDNLDLDNHFEGKGRALFFIKGAKADQDKKMHSAILYSFNGKYYAQITYPKTQLSDFQCEKSTAKFRQYLRENYEGALPGEWYDSVFWKEAEDENSEWGKQVKCEYTKQMPENLLLLGDAAHPVSSIFGDSLNFCLEDCRVLDEVLSTNNTDFHKVRTNYELKRQTDIQAFQKIELCGLVLTTEVAGLTQGQKYSLLALVVPNVIFVQTLAVFIPRYSKYGFTEKLKKADTSYSELLKEMQSVSKVSMVVGTGSFLLFSRLAVSFVSLFFTGGDAKERSRSLLQVINEAFHFA